MSSRAGFFISIALALLAGAALSVLKLGYECLQPISEACVWGKAYFPLTLPMETIVFGALLYAGLTLARKALERHRRSPR